MVNRERMFFLKAGLVFFAVWFLSFGLVGTLAEKLPTRDISSALDRRIPVVPEFIWAYELCYLFPILPLFILKDWHRFNRAVLALIIANVLAFAVFLAFPIAFPRPSLGQGLSARLLAFEYAVDFSPGANKLPSLHVTFAWVVVLVCWRERRRWADALILAGAVLITVSTVFVKQHLVADAAAGLLLALGTWAAAGRLYPRLADVRGDARRAFRRMIQKTAPLGLGGLALLLAAAVFYWNRNLF